MMPLEETARRMDIRNIGNKGNVERNGERPVRTGAKRGDAPSTVRDEAKISAGSRATAAAVDGLAGRARKVDAERDAKVAAAAKKLAAGELDAPAVHAATAQRMLDANFLTA
jgi:hypothetical protein